MSLILSGTGALTLPSGSVLSAAPATGDRSAMIATMSKFLDEFGASLTTSGYQKLPSGLIVQWGLSSSITSGAGIAITLPIAYPTGHLWAGATASGAGAITASISCAVNTLSLTQVSVYHFAGGGGAANYRWISIGY